MTVKAKKKFTFNSGARSKGDPQKIGEALEQIRKKKKKLTGSLVVEAAKEKNSPLHRCFTWDDTKAAQQYRVYQANTLIRSVKVIVEDREPITQYVRVRQEESKVLGKYEPMDEVVHDVDMYQSALEALQGKLSAAARAVYDLETAASSSKRKGQVAMIRIVAKALETANEAVKKLSLRSNP